MDSPDILAAIAAGESDRVEFKAKLAIERIKEAVCAFANTDGGVVILGVADDGAIVGLTPSRDEVQKTLTNLLQSGLSAPARAYLGCTAVDGMWLHWLDVPRQRGPMPLNVGGRIRVRRGRSNHEASGAELQDLFNHFGLVLTEEQLVSNTSIDDIDLRTFYAWLSSQGVDVTTAPQADPVDDLRNHGALCDRPGSREATLYGLLCFGKKPQAHRQMGGHFIHCAAYAGTSLADQAYSVAEAVGCVDQQIEDAERWYRMLGHRERV